MALLLTKKANNKHRLSLRVRGENPVALLNIVYKLRHQQY